MQYQKHFTVEEARETLPQILPMVEEIVSLKKILDEKGYNVFKHQYFGGMGPNGLKAFPLQMERLVEVVAELNKQGIEIKDLDTGLIDFPHVRANGEEVYLCYRLGEPGIETWHSLSGGFAGRRPLEEL